MTIVSGKNRVNRPYFFRDVNGQRVEIPSFGVGQGDLEGADLAEFLMYESCGQIEATSAKTKPENLALPEITGSAKVGAELSATYGDWEGIPEPSKTIQWQRGNSNISGATSLTYTATEADAGKTLRVRVKAANEAGDATVYSSPTDLVTMPPVNIAAPAVTGDPQVGATLTADTGSWNGFPEPTYVMAWQLSINGTSGWAPMSGEVDSSYVVTEDDVGKFIRCEVIANSSEGSKTANSNTVGPITAPDEV